tara:strand:- start:2515 stop:3132 length:618 start_codon:yes stop_codon:yes gene_type:complete
MAKNLVSQPPLNTPIVDKGGLPSRAFAIWMRDVYRRTAYKGGNAIDDNKADTDQDLVDVNATLQETIVQVNENIEAISDDAQGILTNAEGILTNAENLTTHEELEEAHGSNGNVVGFNDLADETVQGLVKRMASLADAVQSTVEVVIADAAAAPVAYSQAHSQSLTDLSNANKAAVNALVTDLNNAILVLNDLIAKSKASGQMTT